MYTPHFPIIECQSVKYRILELIVTKIDSTYIYIRNPRLVVHLARRHCPIGVPRQGRAVFLVGVALAGRGCVAVDRGARGRQVVAREAESVTPRSHRHPCVVVLKCDSG